MALGAYRKKRRFDKTPEPRGGKTYPRRTGLSFVVQKHAASHLHFDFRLEAAGVLKSWAVPKGPSLDPDVKALAIEVEDHPLEYGSFEGTIPEGEYGGGTVMLWDRGTWEIEGSSDPQEAYEAGKLHFILYGERLRGRWMLVRLSKPVGGRRQWLLRKQKDEYARPESQYDVRTAEMKSVVSNRTMEEVAAKPGKSWSSDRSVARAGTPPNPVQTARHALRTRTREGTETPGEVPGAVQAPFPKDLLPQLATLVAHPPQGGQWTHEVKFDGYRIMSFLEQSRLRLVTRGGLDWTAKLSRVCNELRTLPIRSAVLDGEVVALNDRGISDFQELQSTLKARSDKLVYFVFDLPYLNSLDLRPTPLRLRRQLLRDLLQDHHGAVRFSEDIHGHGDRVFHQACRLAIEGVVSKWSDAPYESGRSRYWMKSKCVNRQEVVIGGWTDPQRTRTGFGSLLVGYYRGDDLVYAGRVGAGFDQRMLKELLPRLRAISQDQCPFSPPPSTAERRGAHWVRAKLVAEVGFTQWTREGRMRHPTFEGLRADKEPTEVVREAPARVRPVAPRAGTRRPVSAVPRFKPKRSSDLDDVRPNVNVLGVTITHPDRVLYAKQKITKLNLAEYYQTISRRMLPYLLHRPLVAVRCPTGMNGQCFFQKHFDEEPPRGTHGVPIVESRGRKPYLVVDEPAGLIALVQRGVMEVHTWGCSESDIERPDMLVFDLDPAPDVGWTDLRAAALLLRERLADLSLKSLCKTTGGKGLHVVVPLTPSAQWGPVKQFSREVAFQVVADFPRKFVATMAKEKRRGKVFVDYLRNGRGATAVAPYSTRARAGAPVAMPLTWAELEGARTMPYFTMDDALRRLRKDPWSGYTRMQERQKLPESKASA